MKSVKCAECSKASGFDGCAHVVCPMRKPITAQQQGSVELMRSVGADPILSGAVRRQPTNKE
jgi:hypothetical protein